MDFCWFQKYCIAQTRVALTLCNPLSRCHRYRFVRCWHFSHTPCFFRAQSLSLSQSVYVWVCVSHNNNLMACCRCFSAAASAARPYLSGTTTNKDEKDARDSSGGWARWNRNVQFLFFLSFSYCAVFLFHPFSPPLSPSFSLRRFVVSRNMKRQAFARQFFSPFATDTPPPSISLFFLISPASGLSGMRECKRTRHNQVKLCVTYTHAHYT